MCVRTCVRAYVRACAYLWICARAPCGHLHPHPHIHTHTATHPQTHSHTSLNSPSMSEQKHMSSVSSAPTARQPATGENSNLSPNGVVGSSSFHSAGMSPLFEIVSSYLCVCVCVCVCVWVGLGLGLGLGGYLWTELTNRAPRSSTSFTQSGLGLGLGSGLGSRSELGPWSEVRGATCGLS